MTNLKDSKQTANTICCKAAQSMQRVSRLTRRNEGVLDCIALGEVAQVLIHALDDMSIQSSYIINSSNGCFVFCFSLNSVHCTREGIDKDFTTLHCPIVYPQRGTDSVTVSTDEGELV